MRSILMGKDTLHMNVRECKLYVTVYKWCVSVRLCVWWWWWWWRGGGEGVKCVK